MGIAAEQQSRVRAARGESAPPQRAARPAWARWGGAGVLTGGVLLLLATLVEVALAEERAPALLALFSVLFLGSTLVHAAATVALAGGRSGADGIAGRSALGRLALLAFGAVFMTNQFVYYTVSYALPPVDDYSGAFLLTGGLGIAQFVLMLTGSVGIVRGGAVSGVARWAFPALTVVALGTGMIATFTDSFAVATAALLASTVAQIVVGAVLFTARSRR
ncbi:hypothetical protein JD276_12385 [Leucobacter sp. CSA1]|uniref:Uncharacterized protein n=1 Tax=Leucobacter chromiisoli TaxID=2796471 RepID=A0A934QAN7_9MICO|nr:hypothetical protein [Leucobacter chromiisoli]MBK0419832.1 hypothetical protein [Leucobacter chromiisoli]